MNGVVFDKILFSNVEKLEATDNGYIMWRIPADVCGKMNDGIKMSTGRFCTGVELRFKMLDDKIKLYLQAEEALEAQVAYIFYGSIQGGWQNSSRVIGSKKTEIMIERPDNMETLRRISREQNFAYDPEVVRIVLPYGNIYYHGIEGNIAAPDETELPQKTYLAYGSSITHGSLSLAAPYSYGFRVAQKLNCDFCNMGFAGSAQLEEEMARYLISRKDWNFASFEMGINMLDFSTENFSERVENFMQVLANDDRTMVITDIFGHTMEGTHRETANKYREIVKKSFQKILYNKENIHYIDGLKLLNNDAFLSQDLVHPSLEGIQEIAANLYDVIKKYVSA